MIITANPVILSTDDELEATRKQAETWRKGELNDLINGLGGLPDGVARKVVIVGIKASCSGGATCL